jgi:hypothetical protein
MVETRRPSAGRLRPLSFALVALAAVFGRLAYHWTRVVLGPRRERFDDHMPRSSRIPLWPLAAVLLVLGVFIPAPLRKLLETAAAAVTP